MSQMYSTEPQTTGQVTLETTHGPIDIHLWCKECPHTCRLFLQLALDGYYDDLSFHRIMENFMIQTGLRESSDEARVDAYYDTLERSNGVKMNPLETMARIRFNHRGQVAMARSAITTSTTDSDQEKLLRGQFFITLDANTTHLNDQHVIFGTIIGPTIFNAMRVGRIETSEEGIPMDLDSCPKIKNITIKDHTFSDLTMSAQIPWKVSTTEESEKKKKKKRKGKRDLNVLSFGQEEEEMDLLLQKDTSKKMKSSHDVVNHEIGSRLSQKVDDQVAKMVYGNDDIETSNDEKNANQATNTIKSTNESSSSKIETSSLDKEDSKLITKDSGNEIKPSSQEPSVHSNKTQSQQEEKSTTTTTTHTSTTEPLPQPPSKPKMSAVEARRAKYLTGKNKRNQLSSNTTTSDKNNKNGRDEDTLAKLSMFRSKVSKLKSSSSKSSDTNTESVSYHGQILQQDSDNEKDNPQDWMKTRFKCRRHVDDESMGKDTGERTLDDYVVIDEKSNHHHQQSHRDRDRGNHRGGGRHRHHNHHHHADQRNNRDRDRDDHNRGGRHHHHHHRHKHGHGQR